MKFPFLLITLFQLIIFLTTCVKTPSKPSTFLTKAEPHLLISNSLTNKKLTFEKQDVLPTATPSNTDNSTVNASSTPDTSNINNTLNSSNNVTNNDDYLNSSNVDQNDNHSNQNFIDPSGNTFEHVEYVRELSPYAKEDIKDMNNPLKKDKALVGKPFYIENNITFDESPRIFHEIIETQISKVETPTTPTNQYGLWKNWLGNKHYQDVSYAGSDKYPLTKPEEDRAAQLAPQETYYNPNHQIIPPKPDNEGPSEYDRVRDLVNIKNPLKRQIYSVGYDNTFVKTDNEVVSELHDIADDVVQDIDTYEIKKPNRGHHQY